MLRDFLVPQMETLPPPPTPWEWWWKKAAHAEAVFLRAWSAFQSASGTTDPAAVDRANDEVNVALRQLLWVEREAMAAGELVVFAAETTQALGRLGLPWEARKPA